MDIKDQRKEGHRHSNRFNGSLGGNCLVLVVAKLRCLNPRTLEFQVTTFGSNTI